MLGEGQIYHENEDNDGRVYIGNLATHATTETLQPNIELGGKGKLVILVDNPDGEKTGITIEGVFQGTLWEPKYQALGMKRTYF